MVPLINGKEPSYANISINILSGQLAAVSQLNYTVTQAKTNNYGTGTEPVSRGIGAKEYSCSMEILKSDIDRLRDASSDNSLLSLPMFDIVVVYNNGTTIVTDVIKNCEFSDDGYESSQGDTAIKRTYNLTPSHILFNQ